MEPATTTAPRLLTFRVDKQLYALPADQVAEVIRVPVFARIPQGPPALVGLANLRGAVLPLASLRVLLNKPVIGAEDERAIVLDVGAPIALIVDSVEALETADIQQIETHNKEVNADGDEKLIGAFASKKAGKEVAKILDIKTMLEAAFSQRARAQRQTRTVNSTASSAVADISKNSEAIVSFEVAGQEFALPLEAVQEILAAPASITAVPRAESVVLGVISVRDSLLPLLSLRTLLGFAATTGDEREKVIVMKIAGTRIGLVADRARSIVKANTDHMESLPPILAVRTGGESRIRSIYRAEGGRRLISILSPEQLFREDVMQKLVAGRRAAGSQAQGIDAGERQELIFLVFRLGEEEFGLPIDTVVEVAQVPPQITRVPKTPKFLEGVVNLRGDVLPVVDQRRRFEMPKLENADGRKLIVVKTERYRAGLIVDSVSDVLRTAPGKIEPPPNLTDATSRLVRGVINLDATKRMVLVLDPTEVLTRAEQGVLEKFETGQKANA